MTDSTVMARFKDADQALRTAYVEIVDLTERTLAAMYPGGVWVTLFDSPDYREVQLGEVLDADGNVIAKLHELDQGCWLPAVPVQIAEQWGEDEFRRVGRLDEWLTDAYKEDALAEQLPERFPADGCYPLPENRPCLKLLREDSST